MNILRTFLGQSQDILRIFNRPGSIYSINLSVSLSVCLRSCPAQRLFIVFHWIGDWGIGRLQDWGAFLQCKQNSLQTNLLVSKPTNQFVFKLFFCDKKLLLQFFIVIFTHIKFFSCQREFFLTNLKLILAKQ